MIQRHIHPKPRFVTLVASVPSTGVLVGAPYATLWKAAFFRFTEDVVMHSMLINSTLTANGAASLAIGAVAFNQGEESIGFNLGGGLSNAFDGILWRDELQNPAAGVISDGKSTQFMFSDFFCHTGTGIGIYVNGITSTLDINATISFNPLSEWVNFREPTSGVRI
jgi:hypothetical protein